MRHCKGFGKLGLVYRLGASFLLLIIAISSGLYLGKISVSDEPIVGMPAAPPASKPEPAAADTAVTDQDHAEEVVPPLYFFPGRGNESDWGIVETQIAMAAEADINRYVVAITPGWFSEEREADAQRYNALLERYVALNDRSRFLVQVNLNPPVRWFEKYPEAAMRINDAYQPYPSPVSSVWREAANEALAHIVNTLESGVYGERILGYVLCALQEQRWILPDGFDSSRANQQGFSIWLRNRYPSDSALQAAWENEDITLAEATIPARPDLSEASELFLELPAMQPVSDFSRYSSETVADALASLAAWTARITTQPASVIIAAPYGHAFEALANDSGHFALELLLESDLNTLMAPVSYVDRGLGGVGGMMGPVDSMTVRGKQWLLIDDTRTGVERDAATGEFARIKGINAADVYEVQRRNFSMALTYGLGLVWADPQGEGWLHDSEQWTQFGNLNTIYADHIAAIAEDNESFGDSATMTVVVDEASRFYLQCDGRVNGALLQKGRDAALRAGVSLRFHLLRDVIEDVAPPTPVYLFLNAFHLTDTDRARLHSRLAREQASAIWMYAPGYIAENADAENIAATTGMDVKRFEAPFQTGSTYLLSGQYMRAEERFGAGEVWAPAFYIAPEEETDFLARYINEENKGSIAILTLPEGWTSVYIAEPELTPALLREILQLLEQHIFLTPSERVYYDTVFARDDIVALHASQSGKRSLYFGRFYDIEDLIDPDIGWPQKDSIMLPVRTGETRILRQNPLRTGAG